MEHHESFTTSGEEDREAFYEALARRAKGGGAAVIADWRSGAGPPPLLGPGATADHTTTWRFVGPLLGGASGCR